jgi:hypothetical protein
MRLKLVRLQALAATLARQPGALHDKGALRCTSVEASAKLHTTM